MFKKNLNSINFQRKKKKPEDDKRELNQNKHIYILYMYLWTAPFCFSPPMSRLNDPWFCVKVSQKEGPSVLEYTMYPRRVNQYLIWGLLNSFGQQFHWHIYNSVKIPPCLLMA